MRLNFTNNTETLHLRDEQDLREALVYHLRMNRVLFVSNMAEVNRREEDRMISSRLGYQKGMPDIIILQESKNKRYNMLAIELKSPTGLGTLSTEQKWTLVKMEKYGKAYCVVSNDLEELKAICQEYLHL